MPYKNDNSSRLKAFRIKFQCKLVFKIKSVRFAI